MKTSQQQEIRFLAGPQSRWEELKFTVRTMVELIRGFRALHFAGPCVTFFGSARFREDHEYYRRTRELAGVWAAGPWGATSSCGRNSFPRGTWTTGCPSNISSSGRSC